MVFCGNHNDWETKRALHNYIVKFHDEGNSASSLWSVHSIICKFWKKHQNEDLEDKNASSTD